MLNMLKRFFAVVMLALMPVTMTACAYQPQAVQGAQMTYTKALYAAEAGFKGVTVALEAAVDSGALKGEDAAKALATYDTIKATLDKARTTKQQADAVLAQSLIADLWSTLSSFTT